MGECKRAAQYIITVDHIVMMGPAKDDDRIAALRDTTMQWRHEG